MLFKWFIIGGLVGFIGAIVLGEIFANAIGAAVFTGAGAVMFRKWVFRTFWS